MKAFTFVFVLVVVITGCKPQIIQPNFGDNHYKVNYNLHDISTVKSGAYKYGENYDYNVNLCKDLTSKGMMVKDVKVSSHGKGTDNKLSILFDVNEDFSQEILAIVSNSNSIEKGRTKTRTEITTKETHYIDFIFDTSINLDRNDFIVLK
ncbi:hypothetical protein SAMN05216474_1107 [Lishizhenia tianjinensis]|uniref:Lipoprotein n=1 Tax=Lishizhenia tianjinensis TaxID=477690 RepID=A0A1I6YR37_9FLAO|nr:hypothetical protein [Lishizhenia tianjinensis]SFT52936.1 hypothetical protein SAMN05216474_1107 [Lishizhenia tianjinensis]